MNEAAEPVPLTVAPLRGNRGTKPTASRRLSPAFPPVLRAAYYCPNWIPLNAWAWCPMQAFPLKKPGDSGKLLQRKRSPEIFEKRSVAISQGKGR